MVCVYFQKVKYSFRVFQQVVLSLIGFTPKELSLIKVLPILLE